MSAFDSVQKSLPIISPGLYSIHNIDTQTVLDQSNCPKSGSKICCCGAVTDESISNPNQLWLLALIGDGTWMLINKRSGDYLAAPDDNCSVYSQVGHQDWTSAHWKIVAAPNGKPGEVNLMSIKHPESCLELVDTQDSEGIVKIGTQDGEAPGQTWFLKKQI